MKLSLLLASLGMFFCSPVDAQPFQRSLGESLNERPNCIEHTNDGGYIIAGTQKLLSDI